MNLLYNEKIIFYFKANVQRTCIDADADAMMADGSLKKVKDLEIGDKVRTLDSNGRLTETDVVMMMDISEEDCMSYFFSKFFLKFKIFILCLKSYFSTLKLLLTKISEFLVHI